MADRVHLGFACDACGDGLREPQCPRCGLEGTLHIAREDFAPLCGGAEKGPTVGEARVCSPCLEVAYDVLNGVTTR